MKEMIIKGYKIKEKFDAKNYNENNLEKIENIIK